LGAAFGFKIGLLLKEDIESRINGLRDSEDVIKARQTSPDNDLKCSPHESLVRLSVHRVVA
jgi:hypothetical protein